MQKITPFLWFESEAEQAATFYTSLFKDSRVLSVQRYGDAGPLPKGTALTVQFELEGQEFTALNGGPGRPFTDAVSFVINCQTQAEVDELWERIGEEGEPGPCGWIKDKYGLSWQVVPTALGELLGDPDPEKANRVMAAMLTMSKIDIQALRDARDHTA